MGFYEGPQEVLARPDNFHGVVIMCSVRAFTGFSCRAIYLYAILIRFCPRPLENLVILNDSEGL